MSEKRYSLWLTTACGCTKTVQCSSLPRRIVVPLDFPIVVSAEDFARVYIDGEGMPIRPDDKISTRTFELQKYVRGYTEEKLHDGVVGGEYHEVEP